LAYEADYTRPSSADVQCEWSSTSIPFVFLQGVCKDSFTFNSIILGICTLQYKESITVSKETDEFVGVFL